MDGHNSPPVQLSKGSRDVIRPTRPGDDPTAKFTTRRALLGWHAAPPALTERKGEKWDQIREKRDVPIFGSDYFQIRRYGHDHMYVMRGHAIQALFIFCLAAFSRYVNSIEVLGFLVFLRATQSEAALPF